MSKKYLKVTDLKVPIYNQLVRVVETNSLKKVTKYFEEIDDECNWDAVFEGQIFAITIEGIYKSKGVDCYCIYVVFNPEHCVNSLTYGTVAHEAHHVMEFLFDRIGVKIDTHNAEPTTYLLGWLVDEILKILGVSSKIKWSKQKK